MAHHDETMLASLESGRVHVWCVTGEDLANPSLLREGASDLTVVEFERAARFARPEDRNRFVAGRWLLRQLLAAYTMSVPRQITFEIGRHGRPELADLGWSHIHFNLSHTEGLVACAIASGNEVGIDIERIQASRFDMEVAWSCFNIEACRDVLDAAEGSQIERFLDYWVLMEAYAKARGTGLLSPPAESFVLEGGGRSRIRLVTPKVDDPTKWGFWLFEPAVGYRMAIALVGEPGGTPIMRKIRADKSYDILSCTLCASGTFRQSLVGACLRAPNVS